ncbi:hypothetical protein LZ626_16505 [Aeromonas allosaccharophila]|uniref:hypothetical protein n=1 Tax=Aeromonas allosaccharophila TaxID=656 RepID=UPI001F3778F6|nr:hypothetical protein [Aeromonas allosaccharophila]MCE9849686.1 hypothetical protein [Aeromonas allosaccharophila]
MVNVLVSIFVTLIFIVAVLALQADLASLFGVSMNSTSISLVKDVLTPVFTAFGGALSGVMVAYKLSQKQSTRDKMDSDYTHVVQSYNALIFQLNDLLVYKRDVILPFCEKPIRAIAMPRTLDAEPAFDRVSNGIVGVAVKYQDFPMSQSSMLAEKTYLNAKKVIQRRNTIHADYIEAIESNGYEIFSVTTLAYVVELYGLNKVCNLYHLTEETISIVDDSIEKLQEALNKLDRFIEIEFVSAGYPRLSNSDAGGDSMTALKSRTKGPVIESMEHLKELARSCQNYSQFKYPQKIGKITFNKV